MSDSLPTSSTERGRINRNEMQASRSRWMRWLPGLDVLHFSLLFSYTACVPPWAIDRVQAQITAMSASVSLADGCKRV
jgi:hypothetical protein